MSICVAAAMPMVLAASAFTLSWTHSVEKTEWRENWIEENGALRVVEARVKGSGAGMEPPEGSRLDEGWWVYAPNLPPVPQLVLAASGATGSGWDLCTDAKCIRLAADAGEPVVISVCKSRP